MTYLFQLHYIKIKIDKLGRAIKKTPFDFTQGVFYGAGSGVGSGVGSGSGAGSGVGSGVGSDAGAGVGSDVDMEGIYKDTSYAVCRIAKPCANPTESIVPESGDKRFVCASSKGSGYFQRFNRWD